MEIIRSPADLAALCRQLRERAGKTQAEVAEAIGAKNVQEVSNAENPRQSSRFAVRQRILAHFGYRASEVFIVEPTEAP